jgi:hypothetical protein
MVTAFAIPASREAGKTRGLHEGTCYIGINLVRASSSGSGGRTDARRPGRIDNERGGMAT